MTLVGITNQGTAAKGPRATFSPLEQQYESVASGLKYIFLLFQGRNVELQPKRKVLLTAFQTRGTVAYSLYSSGF
jgi:hypothetical protein